MTRNIHSVRHALTTRLLAIAAFITLAGCASAPERHAVPAELITQVSIPGIPEFITAKSVTSFARL